MPIIRATGTTKPIRWFPNVEGKGESTKDLPNWENVTSVEMRVYEDSSRTEFNPVVRLTGAQRGFDSGIWFTVTDGDWSGTRHFEVYYVDGGDTNISKMDTWVQS